MGVINNKKTAFTITAALIAVVMVIVSVVTVIKKNNENKASDISDTVSSIIKTVSADPEDVVIVIPNFNLGYNIDASELIREISPHSYKSRNAMNDGATAYVIPERIYSEEKSDMYQRCVDAFNNFVEGGGYSSVSEIIPNEEVNEINVYVDYKNFDREDNLSSQNALFSAALYYQYFMNPNLQSADVAINYIDSSNGRNVYVSTYTEYMASLEEPETEDIPETEVTTSKPDETTTEKKEETSATVETTETTDIDIVEFDINKLTEIKNWIVGGIWNNGICSLDSYYAFGTDPSGNPVDGEYLLTAFKTEYMKASSYSAVMEAAPDDFTEIKECYRKIMEQVDDIYQEIISRGTETTGESLNIDELEALVKEFCDLYGRINFSYYN